MPSTTAFSLGKLHGFGERYFFIGDLRTKNSKNYKVNVVTLGCSKNIYDSEVLMGQLKANNYEVEHDSNKEDYDIAIINTCGFIEEAKQESIDTILNFAEAKENGLIDKLYVTGCLSERYGGDLRKEIPEVDSFFGTRDLPRLLKTLKADYKKELLGERLLSTPNHFAYFKISEGCDRPCSFCAIPLMRGGHKSTSIEDLVSRAESLAKQGVKELILIAQDLTYYGLDLYKKRNLAELLRALVKVEGIEWIRLHYAFPAGFPMDVLDVMAEEPKICNYLDIPLQHASDAMLKSMRRGISLKKTNETLAAMREKVPGIAIRTTLISGYPGETEGDFQTMLNWVQEQQFERLGVFNYSHEEDTHAFNLEDDVPQEVKQERNDAIMEAQSSISLAKNQAMVGREFKVLIDRAEGDYFVGRTEYDSPEVDNEVLIPIGEDYLRVGDFAQVRITGADMYDLQAELI